MNNALDETAESSRRQLLRHALGLASTALLGTSTLARAATQGGGTTTTTAATSSPPRITFMGREAGAAALAHGDTYYASMGLLESRARTKSPLAGKSLADARIAVRDYDAAAVLPFTDEQRTAIGGVIERMQPLLAVRAPLYARTPWSFIQLDDRAEGGMPHTRGPHIVMPKAFVDGAVTMHRELAASGKLAVSGRGRSILIHEQTHVLERTNPALFEPLFTDVFGFTRMTPAPTTPWLDAHTGINPDGPDVVWAFALDKIGGRGWIMPDVLFPDLPVPRMPEDFQAVGIEVARTAGGWKIVEEDGQPKRRDLDKIPGYDTHFPFPDEDFHPTEVAAVALAHWILQDVPDVNERPLMPAVAGWARKALA
jgi:hypothetical protein